jgi:hypothetical protein
MAINFLLVLLAATFEIVALLFQFGRRLFDSALLSNPQMFDGAAKLVDFVLLGSSFRFEFLRDSPALSLRLLAANFELLGLPREPLFELLATAAAAGQLLGFELRLGLSPLVRLLTLGKFDPRGIEFVALSR